MVADIGEVMFREILGMSAYPGSPFTGEIFRDIILFFFVPTVFLIIFVYLASGLIIPPTVKKLRLLMALAIYSFIIASRYYEGFAIFASQFYFVFVIFIGILYFIGTHFRRASGGGGMAYEGGGMAYEGGDHGGKGRNVFDFRERARINKRLREVNAAIADLEKRLNKAQSSGARDAPVWAERLSALLKEKADLEKELEISPIK